MQTIYRRREVEERTQAKFEQERASKMAADAAAIEGGGKIPNRENVLVQELEGNGGRTVCSATEVKICGIADKLYRIK